MGRSGCLWWLLSGSGWEDWSAQCACRTPWVSSSSVPTLLALRAVLRLAICWGSARDPQQESTVRVSPLHPLPCPSAALGTTSLLKGWLSAMPKSSSCSSRAPCGGGRQL